MASALLAIRCLCHWWIKVATLFGSFDLIPRRWIDGMVVPFLDPNSFVALKSRSTPLWSLFVNHWYGGYPMELMLLRSEGEQKMASMRVLPLWYVLKFSCSG